MAVACTYGILYLCFISRDLPHHAAVIIHGAGSSHGDHHKVMIQAVQVLQAVLHRRLLCVIKGFLFIEMENGTH